MPMKFIFGFFSTPLYLIYYHLGRGKVQTNHHAEDQQTQTKHIASEAASVYWLLLTDLQAKGGVT